MVEFSGLVPLVDVLLMFSLQLCGSSCVSHLQFFVQLFKLLVLIRVTLWELVHLNAKPLNFLTDLHTHTHTHEYANTHTRKHAAPHIVLGEQLPKVRASNLTIIM